MLEILTDEEVNVLRVLVTLTGDDPGFGSVEAKDLRARAEMDHDLLLAAITSLEFRGLIKAEHVQGPADSGVLGYSRIWLTCHGREFSHELGTPRPADDGAEALEVVQSYIAARGSSAVRVGDIASAKGWTVNRAGEAATWLCENYLAVWVRSPINMGQRAIAPL